MNKPIGIDLFAGAGGLSLGFEQAGFDVVAAVEIDPVHCAIHKYNFPNTTVLCRSVENLTGKELRTQANIGDQEIDCVFGGAPCQGFSLIGQRVLDDPRNMLVKEYVRLIFELQPKSFVFENVKGLTVGKHKEFLQELIKALENAGYELTLPWKVLNAGNYGVPQSRERLFLMGSRKGIKLPQYPIKTTSIAGKTKSENGPPIGPNCFDALNDLPNADEFETLLKSDAVKTNRFGMASKYAENLKCTSDDDWYFGYKRIRESSLLTSSSRTNHSEISRRRFSETLNGEVEPISRYLKLRKDGVSNTLRAGTDSSRGAFTSPRPIHYKYNRCITVREMARLHGFPDWFRFHKTKWHGARQIGNSVPPPLARAVASSIVEALGIKAMKVKESVPLGDPSLLSYDMTQASQYFKVVSPIGTRNRKSGTKKRKQIDIERERLKENVAYG